MRRERVYIGAWPALACNMGVKELLKRLESHCTHLEDWFEVAHGCRVGVDMMVWLHLFASVFYDDLVAEPPRFNRVAAAVCQRVNALIGSGVGVVPVFDGGGTAAKAGTSAKRAATAEKRKAKILQVLESCRLGNVEGVDEEHLKRQLGQAQAKITPDLVDAVIILFRKSGFSYLVAPHEADHQLVHMLQIGVIDYIVTVDSDLLCHTGVKTIVTAIGGFMGGEARLFNPGCLVKMPSDSDLGSVIQNAVRHQYYCALHCAEVRS